MQFGCAIALLVYEQDCFFLTEPRRHRAAFGRNQNLMLWHGLPPVPRWRITIHFVGKWAGRETGPQRRHLRVSVAP